MPRLLSRIRSGIKEWVVRQIVADEPEPDMRRCPHADEDRISHARMGHPDAFICGRCGYQED